MKKIKDTDMDKDPNAPGITAIMSYSKGFASSLGSGTVCLFEKQEEDNYRRIREIRVKYVNAGNIGTAGSVCVSKWSHVHSFPSDPFRPTQQRAEPGWEPEDWHHVHQSSRGDSGHQHRQRTAVQLQPVLFGDEQGRTVTFTSHTIVFN